MTNSSVLNTSRPVARLMNQNQAGVCRQVLASAGSAPCTPDNPALRQPARYAVWVYPRARTGVAP